MDHSARLDELLMIAAESGIEIRREPLGGEGGGLCKLKGRHVLFVDVSADLRTRYENTLKSLAELPGLSERYLPPAIREDLDRINE